VKPCLLPGDRGQALTTLYFRESSDVRRGVACGRSTGSGQVHRRGLTRTSVQAWRPRARTNSTDGQSMAGSIRGTQSKMRPGSYSISAIAYRHWRQLSIAKLDFEVRGINHLTSNLRLRLTQLQPLGGPMAPDWWDAPRHSPPSVTHAARPSAHGLITGKCGASWGGSSAEVRRHETRRRLTTPGPVRGRRHPSRNCVAVSPLLRSRPCHSLADTKEKGRMIRTPSD
jgi:hypothetical protein